MILFHERTINKNKFPNGKTFWLQKYKYNRSVSKIKNNCKKMMTTSTKFKSHCLATRGSICQTKTKKDFASTSENHSNSLLWFT
jgi:hypothetical protein